MPIFVAYIDCILLYEELSSDFGGNDLCFSGERIYVLSRSSFQALDQRIKHGHCLGIGHYLCKHCWINIPSLRQIVACCFGCFFLSRFQFPSTVKRFLQRFRFMLPVLVYDIRVDIRNHVDLRVAEVALHGFDIAAVKFQLIYNASMAQTVKDDLRKVILLDQFIQVMTDHGVRHRKTCGCCHDDLVIHVLLSSSKLFSSSNFLRASSICWILCLHS